jgi:DNA-binding winged helix-turn-helix (wHTH) protein
LEEYLLNGNVTFFTSSSKLTTNSLTAEKQEVKLDNLESLVLNLLVINSFNIVSHEQFLSNWRSPEATANSLFRVISKLRGKLKKVGLTDNVILNTPKKGYSLVTLVELKSDSNKVDVNRKVLLNNDKDKYISYAIAFLLSSFMVLGLLNYLKNKEKTDINTENISYFELLSNTEIKLELTSNSKNEFIAYSTKVHDGKYWGIEIFDRFSDKKIIIEDNKNNLRKATWVSENFILYRAYNEKNCRIRAATINFESQTYTSNNIFPCNPESYSSSIAKLNETQILFTEAKLGSKASNLYIGDIKTGSIQTTEADIDNEGGLGIYNVITSPKSDLIALLSSTDGVKDKIRLVDPKNGWNVVWSEILTMTNISVGWNGSLLSFRNNNGGITIVSFEDRKEVNRTHLPFIAPIHNISSTNNGLIFTSGEFVSKNILYTNLINSKRTTLTESLSAKNILAHFYTENLIIYVSNRTGINQVLFYDLKNKVSKQISSFKQNHKIVNIVSSSKFSKVAIEYDNTIEVFDLSPDYVLSVNAEKIRGIKPEFFDDKIVFTKVNESDVSLKSHSLISSHFDNLDIQGGYIAKSSGTNLYYSKLYVPGVWLYQENEKDKLILDLPSSAYQWHIDGENLYYRNDLGDYSKFHITSGIISKFSSHSCKVIINIKDNKCLAAKITPTSNRVILLDW